jgi:hypothetical protein
VLGPVERAVADRLRAGPSTIDAIVATTGLRAAVVSGAVTLLALRGWVQPTGALLLPAGPLLRAPADVTVPGGPGPRRTQRWG